MTLSTAQLLAHTMDRIYRLGLTTTSGGNLSLVDHAGDLWITPRGTDKGRLTDRQIVRIDTSGKQHGGYEASTELPFHQSLLAARPDVKAVVHAHPASLVAFSICHRVPQTRIYPAMHRICGEVGFAEYACPGTPELGRKIADCFATGVNCAVLENHGVVTVGRSMKEAYARFEALEFAARSCIAASSIGEVNALTDEQLQRSEAPRDLADSNANITDANSFLHHRLQLIQFLRRGSRQRLMTGCGTSGSVRVVPDQFLITPVEADFASLSTEDLKMMSVAGDRQCQDAISRYHQAIYRVHPEISCVLLTHPVNTTAFSATDIPLDVRTIPESLMVLRNVGRIPFESRYGEPSEFATQVSSSTPSALIENDGVVVTGTSLLDGYDRLEVLELTAEAILRASAIGPLTAMSDQAIANLPVFLRD